LIYFSYVANNLTFKNKNMFVMFIGHRKGSRPAKHGGGGQTTGMSGVVDTVTQRVLSARRLKINELRNENEALKRQMAAIIEENKTMKRSMHAQGRALDR
jgi:hypothetical protein